MDLSVSPKNEIWLQCVCHHISTGLYFGLPQAVLPNQLCQQIDAERKHARTHTHTHTRARVCVCVRACVCVCGYFCTLHRARLRFNYLSVLMSYNVGTFTSLNTLCSPRDYHPFWQCSLSATIFVHIIFTYEKYYLIVQCSGCDAL